MRSTPPAAETDNWDTHADPAAPSDAPRQRAGEVIDAESHRADAASPDRQPTDADKSGAA